MDGFDRTTGSYSVARHSFAALYGDALGSNAMQFDCADNDAVQRGDVSLSPYPNLVWFVGDESTADLSLNTIEQGLIQNYLQSGGHLFISGSELGYDLGRSASPNYAPNFYADYLKASYLGDKAGTLTYAGAAGSAFEGISGSFGSIYPEDYPDYIAPSGGSVAALSYSASQTAGIQYAGSFGPGTATGKLVYVGFGVETIGSSAARATLMTRVIGFFEGIINAAPEAWYARCVGTGAELSESIQSIDRHSLRCATVRICCAEGVRRART